ncbi:PadR family transcriptional regulator [Amycolatopsis taiwanensis]|uniref:PadR family transcriptional regulator n=1 Tax=Amycolatopsis taiwanensis TaxID=342230 RepID=UPI000482D1C8|nr:PadR family transcriptional regulator [Amycolatopsis taiwanensis]
MSATRLLVLGVVRMHGKAHGYQVRRELLTWSADRWANIQPGSVYHALKKMTAEQLLEQVDVEPGQGPDRTAYRITADGETEFHVQLAQTLSSADSVTDAELAAGITLMTTLPRERVITLLRHSTIQLEARQQSAQLMAEQLAGQREGWGQPAHIRELFLVWQMQNETSLSWLRGLIERLEAGEYVMADDSGRAFGQPAK